jgi:hypothetical protein
MFAGSSPAALNRIGGLHVFTGIDHGRTRHDQRAAGDGRHTGEVRAVNRLALAAGAAVLVVVTAVVVWAIDPVAPGSANTPVAVPASGERTVLTASAGALELTAHLTDPSKVLCDTFYRSPLPAQELASTVTARSTGTADLLRQARAEMVNEPVRVAVRGTQDDTHRVTGVSVRPVATRTEAPAGVYLVRDDGCDWSTEPEVTGLPPSESFPVLVARFGGNRVALANDSTTFRAPDFRPAAFGVAPFACADEVQEWELAVDWMAGDQRGTAVLGPFRTLPDQRLALLRVSGDAGSLTVQEATGTTVPERPCARAPVADPVRPDPAVDCGPVRVEPNGIHLTVRLTRTGTDCATALRVADTYVNDDSVEKSGSGRYADIGEWTCGGGSIKDVTATGIGRSCWTETTTILLGVP